MISSNWNLFQGILKAWYNRDMEQIGDIWEPVHGFNWKIVEQAWNEAPKSCLVSGGSCIALLCSTVDQRSAKIAYTYRIFQSENETQRKE